MEEGRMLAWILVGCERLLGINSIQSRELGAGILIVCFVLVLGPLVHVRIWFTPYPQGATIV